MILLAPAKINLHLRVIGKRKDGYHNIETLFEKIALFDKIKIRPSNKLTIHTDSPSVPTGKKSLLYRTAESFREKFKVSAGAEVHVFKRIPIAAGLGGGSSDAAGLLKGLAKMHLGSFDPGELLDIGAKLGADIPFFLSNASFAIARGKGDKITPLKLKNRFWHLIVRPPKKLLSGDIYTAYKKSYSGLTKRPSLIKILSPATKALGNNIMGRLLWNDLERAIIKRSPLVGRLKESIKGLKMPHTLISGSGPALFSLFNERKEALKARQTLFNSLPFVKNKGWQIFVVSTA